MKICPRQFISIEIKLIIIDDHGVHSQHTTSESQKEDQNQRRHLDDSSFSIVTVTSSIQKITYWRSVRHKKIKVIIKCSSRTKKKNSNYASEFSIFKQIIRISV